MEDFAKDRSDRVNEVLLWNSSRHLHAKKS